MANHIRDGAVDVIYDNGRQDFDLDLSLVEDLTEKDVLKEKRKFRAVVLDPSVSKSMAEVIANIFIDDMRRGAQIANRTLFLALTPFVILYS